MKNLTSQSLRQLFLKFFEEKGHKIIPSASLVPKWAYIICFGNFPVIKLLIENKNRIFVTL